MQNTRHAKHSRATRPAFCIPTRPPAKDIGRLALEAMLVEVSVTPKPGLVDRNNSGAHSDMGFFTFLKSAAGLRNAFDKFALAGYDSPSPHEMFTSLRKLGLEAERDMFAATGGINTHKGEIFSLGVLCGCAGWLAHHGVITPENVLKLAGVVCAGLCESDFAGAKTKPRESLTKGERAYLEHGITGIRGEAEAGYPSVMNHGLPALSRYLSEGHNMNDALAFTLIHIMAVSCDTNIISRHDLATAQEVMNSSKRLISEGLTLEKLHNLDAEFISHNISPSGSADLLAATYFIYSLAHPSPNL